MNPDDKNEIISRYRNRLLQYGVDIKTLSSGNIERQRVRFDVLSQIGDMEGASVLDIGSGFGDFYGYLLDRGIRVSYTGYEICPDFVKIAQDRFPEARFEVRDIQEKEIPQTYDYIVSSQTFNNRLMHEDNLELMKDILQKCYMASSKGVVIDMLTSYVDFREDHLYYYSPELIFSFCKSLTKRVTLRHDYPLYEFAVFLYKDFTGWRPGEQVNPA